MSVVDELRPLLCQSISVSDSFPMLTGVELQDCDGILRFTVQKLTFDDGQVTDVIEQELYFGRVDDYDNAARNQALAAALMAVLHEVLTTVERSTWDGAMPSDLMPADLVTLGNCETQAHFEKALRTKKRLGRLLR